MAEIASAYVSILPSMKGFATKLASEGGGETAAAGGLLGRTLGKTMLAGFAAAGLAVGVGKALYEVGQSFEEVRKTIIVGTGASGAALDGLEESAKRIGKRTPASFADIGTAVADLNTRLGLTGKPLEALSSRILNLSRLTGTDLSQNIADVTRVFGDWSISLKDQPKALDEIFTASQATGAGINSLAQSVVRMGAPLRQFGFSFEQSLAMFGKWEKEGVNTQAVMAGLKIGLGKFSKAGLDPQKALAATEKAIKAAGSAGEANAIAIQAFGQRAGPDMAAAVREGRFAIGDLVKTIKGSSGSITDADKRTRTFSETWQLFKNRVLVAIEPIASRVFASFTDGAAKALPAVTRFTNQMRSGKGQGGQFADNLRTVGKVLERMGRDLLAVAGYLNQHRKVLVALVGTYAAWKVVLIASAVATKLQAANDAVATAALAVHTAAVRVSTSTFGTRIGVMAIDAAAWVRSTASTIASTVATTANSVATRLSSLNIGTRIGLLLGSVASWIAATAATVANTVATIASSVAAKAFAAAQWLVNAALTANPIGIVVVALVALAAGLIYAYKHSEKFRAVVDTTFGFIKKYVPPIISAVVNFVKSHWKLLVSIIGGPLAAVAILVATHFGTVKKIAGAVATFVVNSAKKYGEFARAVISKVGDVVSFFKKLPGKIKGFLTSLPGDLKTIGSQIIEGLKRGIEGAAHLVYDAVQSIIDKIPKKIRKIMGIASPSKVTEELGRFIGDGLAAGLEKSGGKVSSAAEKLAKKVKDQIAKVRDQLSTATSDFASLVEPVASNFTQGLFDFTDAASFTANLSTVKGTLTTLLGNFKKLIGEGLNPGFLYQLFQSGGPGLIAGLAGLDKASAQSAGSLFADVQSLSNQLGTAVAGSTDKGAALENQTVRLEKKLDHLIKAVHNSADRIGDKVNGAASHGRRRAA